MWLTRTGQERRGHVGGALFVGPRAAERCAHVLPLRAQASAQPFLVFGLLTTGLAVGASNAALGL